MDIWEEWCLLAFVSYLFITHFIRDLKEIYRGRSNGS